VLLVEHDIDRVFALADRVTVMNEGRCWSTARQTSARRSSAVQEIYIGSGTAQLAAKRAATPSAPSPELLMLTDVNAFYGKSHIVKDASLAVHEREIVALLGRNGAGKSTLLKTIIGIVARTGGQIALGGDDSGRAAAENRAPGIGYVPQGRGLFAGMSVRHNLELGGLKRRGGSGVAWTDEKILDFFPQLEGATRYAGGLLVGGEQQDGGGRRALAGHVRVLLLDEPFEGLRPRSSKNCSRRSTSCATSCRSSSSSTISIWCWRSPIRPTCSSAAASSIMGRRRRCATTSSCASVYCGCSDGNEMNKLRR
jgi:ABC-type branched-subunit amino acid transport system ATPase component